MWTVGLVLVTTLTSLTLADSSHPSMSHSSQDLLQEIQRSKIEAGEIEQRQDLLREAVSLKNLTEVYIGVKLKQNIFNVLRQMSKRELKILGQLEKLGVRPRYPSKLLKQFDGDGDDAAELEAALKITGTIFKQLLLIPKFFRESLETVFPGLRPKNGTMKAPAQSKKQKQSELISLAVQAEEFRKLPPEMQVVGVVSIISNDTEHLSQSVEDSIQQHTLLHSAIGQIKSGTSWPGQVEVDQKLQAGIDLRLRLVTVVGGGSKPNIYGDVDEAYNVLDKLRSFIDHLGMSDWSNRE